MASQQRGPYRVGVERRQRIIEAADKRFSTDGYHETQIAAIARDAGITDAGLLHHFPSKLHLLIAVTERRFSLANEGWRQLGEEPPFLVIIASMWRTTDLATREHARIELDVVVAAEAAATTSLAHQEYAGGLNAAIADTTRRFRACSLRGEIHSWIDPESLARECFALGNGLNTQWIMSHRAFDLSAILLQALGRIAATAATGAASTSNLSQRIRAVAQEYWPDPAVRAKD